MTWEYQGQKVIDMPYQKYGFIYLIEYESGKKYIGKKSFFSFQTLPPLSGQKKKRKVIKQSNWRIYAGSCKDIVKDKIKAKVMLEFANSKQHLTYLEEKHLFAYNVLLDDSFYNKNIAGRYFLNIEKSVGEFLKYLNK